MVLLQPKILRDARLCYDCLERSWMYRLLSVILNMRLPHFSTIRTNIVKVTAVRMSILEPVLLQKINDAFERPVVETAWHSFLCKSKVKLTRT